MEVNVVHCQELLAGDTAIGINGRRNSAQSISGRAPVPQNAFPGRTISNTSE